MHTLGLRGLGLLAARAIASGARCALCGHGRARTAQAYGYGLRLMAYGSSTLLARARDHGSSTYFA
eukprot:scaffold47495_cov281-Isochrysis_galbana.AAC.1